MTRLAFAAALLVATAAFAQAPSGSAGTTFEQFAGKARDRLMALDTDHDGRLTKDEFAARAAMGRHRDKATDEAPRHDGSRMFARLDTNNDGALDAAEVNASIAKRFARRDANHDGMLTPDERHAMHGMNAPEQ